MVRAVWFLVKMCALVAAVFWVARHPGDVRVAWQGYDVETSTGFAAAALLLLFILLLAGDRVLRAVLDMPGTLRRLRAARARDRGYRDVTAGLVAVAAGDATGARKYARRAAALVPEAPLALLLEAQAHLLDGNAPAARRAFAGLLKDDTAAFFGARGLLQQTLAEGDQAGALEHARAAHALQPKRAWILETLFDLETRGRAWARAEEVLKKAVKQNVFPPQAALRHRQSLLLARAEEAFGAGDVVAAHKLARRAFGLDPAFTPAAALLVRYYNHAGKTLSALRALRRAWAARPHPDLAALWMKRAPAAKPSASPYDEGRETLAWARQLHDAQPGHRDSLRMMGAAAMAAGRWREAREYLTRGGDYRGLAKLERAETGNEARAGEWLEIAAEGPAEPKWTCSACGAAALDWSPLCRSCGIFDSSAWTAPMADTHARPALLRAAPVGDLLSPPSAAER